MAAAPPSAPPLSPVGLGEPWIAGVVGAEMAVIAACSLALWIHKRRRGHLKSTTAEQIISPSSWGAACGGGRGPAVAHGIWRFVNLLWFSAYALADWSGCDFDFTWANCNTTMQNEFPLEYTHWNFQLQPVYWAVILLATVFDTSTSCARLMPRLTSALNTSAHGLLEICAPSAWLVSIEAFTLLSPGDPSIFSDRYHFINTLCLTVEFAASRLDVRLGHFILMLAWMMVYIIYTWIMRATHWNEFAHFFMKLDASDALLWYPLVGLMHFIIYSAFVAVSVVTRRCPCLRGSEGKRPNQAGTPSQNTEGEEAGAV